ncbi:MAG: SMP-30/gluconolactonase/LRE family protein [Thermoleophilia bacterium]|nr:SMP-30/gluconolactonase/LRE family protein [Thermoleophilia bacterium]MDH3725296.1 SMP-30/gluconolactonase/LRE family protein [Thermoleophilia bacterium]
MRRSLIPIAIAAALTAIPLASAAQRVGPVETVVAFDAAAGELPEGVAVDRAGNRYVTLAPLGQIVRIDKHGERSLFAQLPVGESGGLLTGIRFDRSGNLWAALASFETATHGVWRITPGGKAERIAALSPTTLPNAFAFGAWGRTYVSDSFGGAVWALDPGQAPRIWAQDRLLEGTDPEFMIGANGLEVRRGSLYVANTQKNLVARIAIGKDGEAGDIATYARDEQLAGADGILFDRRGRLYVAANARDALVVISPKGHRVRTVVDEGLAFPASLAFGRGKDRRSLLITNFDFADRDEPALVKVRVGRSRAKAHAHMRAHCRLHSSYTKPA